MKQYELLLLLNPNCSDRVGEVVKLIVQPYSDIKIKLAEDWGRQRLAYKIGQLRTGHYALLLLECEAATSQSIQHDLRINSDVVRWMMIQCDEFNQTEESLVDQSRSLEFQRYLGLAQEEQPAATEETQDSE